jgi:hypothetical protein
MNLPHMQGLKSLMLHSGWVSKWGRELVIIVFASKGDQYPISG